MISLSSRLRGDIPHDRLDSYSIEQHGRIAEFDGVRGMCSIVVVFGHVVNVQTADHPFGWYAGFLDMFFCLSGFLITYVVLEKYRLRGALDYPAYLTNRALRIWPAYFAAYAFTILISLAGQSYALGEWRANVAPTLHGIIAPLFFMQNVELAVGVERADYIFLFNHSWSVALEEQFYLLGPLMILTLQGRSRAFIGSVLATLLALSLIERAKYISYWTLIARLDAFVLGAVLYSVYSHMRAVPDAAKHRRLGLIFATMAIGAAVGLTPYVMSTYTGGMTQDFVGRILGKTVFEPTFLFSCMAMGLLGFLLFGSRTSIVHRFLRAPILRGLGVISYSTYLFHVPVVCYVCPLISEVLGLGPRFMIAISGPAAVLVAYLAWRYIEQPFMRMRRQPQPMEVTGTRAVGAGSGVRA